jgi:hypothetical protein
MLPTFLKSISDEYEISFRTDSIRRWLFIRVQKHFAYTETFVEYDHLSDELYVIRAIQDTIARLNAMCHD